VISAEIATIVPQFFGAGGRGPSHEELDRLFERAGLAHVAPHPPGSTTGKMKRVRAALWYALDDAPEAGSRLVGEIVRAFRGLGGFHPESENFIGADVLANAQRAFSDVGYDLGPDGAVRPRRLEELEGEELTDALGAYVKRAREGAADDALVVGTDKDLLEAVAKHALVETQGHYSASTNFPLTLYQAFERLGLATLPPDVSGRLDGDARTAVQQAAYLLALAVNRLRNQEGAGKGRPVLTTLRQEDAKLASHATALVCELMLSALEARSRSLVPVDS